MLPLNSSRLVATALLVTAAAIPSQASVFDFAADFSTAANPQNGYTYGYSATAGGSVTAFTLGQTFSSGTLFGYGGFPYIDGNTSGTTFSSGSVLFPPISSGYLLTHPAQDGTYAVISYQLPVGGLLDLSANFTSQDVAGATTDVHVFLNGTELFSGLVLGSSQTYGTPPGGLAVSSGDTLKVSVGNDGSYFNDSTGVRVSGSITPVPEPASMVATVGILLGGFALWRRRRSA